MEILWEAQTNTLRELAANAKDPIEVPKDEPDTFLDIMNGVMNAKKYDVFFALDAPVVAKMLGGMMVDKVKNIFGIGE